MKKYSKEWCFRKVMRKIHNQGMARKIKPLSMESRCYFNDDDYESFTEYGFLPMHLEEYSDAEIEAWIDEEMVMEIRSPYDCTGKQFTKWIDWHRNPSGMISFIHRIGIDV